MAEVLERPKAEKKVKQKVQQKPKLSRYLKPKTRVWSLLEALSDETVMVRGYMLPVEWILYRDALTEMEADWLIYSYPEKKLFKRKVLKTRFYCNNGRDMQCVV